MEPAAATESTNRCTSRWRRLVLRAAERALWHVHGLLLWLVRRPFLRCLPFPYPSVGTVQAWSQQLDQMCEAGVMSKGQLRRIRNQENMNGGTLKDCSWLRDRLGIKTAFLEDPIPRGLLAARGSKGLATRIKAAVTKEEVEKARAKRDQGEALIAIRQLIGRRGGLPTLRGDLIKLATLLHLEVPEKITIDQLKEKIRPVLKTIVDSAPKGSLGSDGHPEPKAKSSPKPSPKREATSSTQPNPNTLQEMEAMLRRQDQRTQEAVLTSMRQIVEELNYRQS